jgi:hypothetical protein
MISSRFWPCASSRGDGQPCRTARTATSDFRSISKLATRSPARTTTPDLSSVPSGADEVDHCRRNVKQFADWAVSVTGPPRPRPGQRTARELRRHSAEPSSTTRAAQLPNGRVGERRQESAQIGGETVHPPERSDRVINRDESRSGPGSSPVDHRRRSEPHVIGIMRVIAVKGRSLVRSVAACCRCG